LRSAHGGVRIAALPFISNQQSAINNRQSAIGNEIRNPQSAFLNQSAIRNPQPALT